jgi:hypothetical protein
MHEIKKKNKYTLPTMCDRIHFILFLEPLRQQHNDIVDDDDDYDNNGTTITMPTSMAQHCYAILIVN